MLRRGIDLHFRANKNTTAFWERFLAVRLFICTLRCNAQCDSMRALSLEEFLELRKQLPVLDVRTPSEYKIAHIIGACNCPLFSDEERARIGTLYKQDGRHSAIMAGLEYTGPRLASYAAELLAHSQPAGVLLYCWRGGMRSSAAGWLASFIGLRANVLQGGYKAFRAGCKRALEKPRKYFVLGGYTGSGKSEILQALRACGEQTLDLENLARHRGSAFGDIDFPPQVSQEHFENLIADELVSMDERPIWIEDESRLLGRLEVPPPLFGQMRQSRVLFLQASLEDRIERLCQNYGHAPHIRLEDGLYAIRKRLGGERTQAARMALQEGDLALFCRNVLFYYDRAYEYGLSRREPASVLKMECEPDPVRAAAKLIEFAYEHSST